MDAKELFKLDVQVVCTVEEVLAFGHSQHWQFQVMQEKGVLTEPILKSDWLYQELRDFTTLPGFAKQRLEKVQKADIPIYQVIYGEEVVDPPETKKIQMPEIPWKKVGKFTLAAAGVIAVGAAFVLVSSAMAAMTMVDPKLIICLNNGSSPETAPWICLISWEK